MNNSQSTSSVMMVRPDGFGFDEQTAATNAFQNNSNLSQQEVRARTQQEFAAMVDGLRAHGIHVTVFVDPDNSLRKPNAVFPNNWLSTWPNGQVYLYPMATESRRIERSLTALEMLRRDYKITQVTDLAETENYRQYLESTGVMIFDHQHRIVYGCVSPRCDATLFTCHALFLGYTPVLFNSFDKQGTPVYHTNVMMGVQSTTAVICAESITDQAQRREVLETLERTGHQVIEITHNQMAAFCGNVLELQNDKGDLFLAMSQTAYDAFTPAQRTVLGRDKTLLPFDISTIETIGGGSVRCMLAEVYLPHKALAEAEISPAQRQLVTI